MDLRSGLDLRRGFSRCLRGLPAHLCDDGCAVLLGPDGGGTLVGSSATSLTPAAFCHPRRHQAGGAGGQVIAARANQRNLCDLGWKRARGCVPKENRSGSTRLERCSLLTLFPVVRRRAPSEGSWPGSATLPDTGLESKRMFTWGEANRENTT